LPPVLAPHEQLYLRSVAPAGPPVASHVPTLFPELAAALAPPPLPAGARFHSSVLRAASAKSALWMHYDTHDNLLSQASAPHLRPHSYLYPRESTVDAL
jgi:hypothetical protein